MKNIKSLYPTIKLTVHLTVQSEVYDARLFRDVQAIGASDG